MRGSSVTVTVQDAVLPFSVETVTDALPGCSAYSTPSPTATISSFELVHVSHVCVAFAGCTEAVNRPVEPAGRVSALLSSVMPVTSTNPGSTHNTRTVQEATLPLEVTARMLVSPADTPYTLPSSTVATFSFKLDHVTRLSAASSGKTVAVSCALFPSSIVSREVFRRMLSGSVSAEPPQTEPQSIVLPSVNSAISLPSALIYKFLIPTPS